jgi:hypothetical protein
LPHVAIGVGKGLARRLDLAKRKFGFSKTVRAEGERRVTVSLPKCLAHAASDANLDAVSVQLTATLTDQTGAEADARAKVPVGL